LTTICLLLVVSSNYNEKLSTFAVFSQTDGITQSTNPHLYDSFSAIGTISSLVITIPESEFNITNAFKVILTGEWNLSVRNGTMTNFAVNFLASPMDGSKAHIHQITNFKPYTNEKPIGLTEDGSLTANGTADIKINGIVVWPDSDISVSISKGKVFSLDPDDKDTGNHFEDQSVYGVVTQLI
jgi:hypothetical protein